MRRREVIAGLGAAAIAGAHARAQQAALPLIGFIGGASAAGYPELIAAFKESLAQAGYVEGQNVRIEYRWSEDRYDRLPALAGDLVRLKPSLMVVVGTTAAVVAAKAATTSIPIVFFNGSDPVARGFVASLNRPGGNVTGVTLLTVEAVQKRLEILRELVPAADPIAVVVNTDNPNMETYSRDVAAAARVLGRRIDIVAVGHEAELDAAFVALVQRHAGATVFTGAPIFTDSRDRLLALAARHRIPAMYAYRDFATAGGLMSYGPNRGESIRQVGDYAARILKGANPGDLPVQQATKVELAINLKTAKTLGLEVPQTLLARADEVIE
jgi:putative ABC transport system substrate-binding protein